MKQKLIGRSEERAVLQGVYDSFRPEFIAVYGRRRVGKTFLVREFYQKKSKWFFNVTGIQDGDITDQIARFVKEIGQVFYKGIKLPMPQNWFEAFDLLMKEIDDFVAPNQKIVLFFDEFPWMVTHRSKLLTVVEYMWNQYWSNDSRIKLIVCGSSASWIIKKIINNKGGLHNRITQKIQLLPFNLSETKAFLQSFGVKLNSRQIVQLYMVTGGVPYYLAACKKGMSATELIEHLAFKQNSLLFKEFDNLFSSLFDDAVPYIELLKIIAKHRYGISQQAVIKSSKRLTAGGTASKRLAELEEAGFIMSFVPHFHQKRGIYYRVIDEYSLFYLRWIDPIRKTLQHQSQAVGYWESEQQTPAWKSWSGYAFEALCYKHLPQIRTALQMPPNAIAGAWSYRPKMGSDEQGAQIDLLFDRKDDVISLCEIKYSDKPFVIDKACAANLLAKKSIFKAKTKTSKQLFIVMVVANGLKDKLYSDDLIDKIVVLQGLFR